MAREIASSACGLARSPSGHFASTVVAGNSDDGIFVAAGNSDDGIFVVAGNSDDGIFVAAGDSDDGIFVAAGTAEASEVLESGLWSDGLRG